MKVFHADLIHILTVYYLCFRIVALAEPPVLGRGQQWLSPEILSLFIFHEMRNLSKSEEIFIINSLVSIEASSVFIENI